MNTTPISASACHRVSTPEGRSPSLTARSEQGGRSDSRPSDHPGPETLRTVAGAAAPFVLLQAALPLLRRAAVQSPTSAAKVVALDSITGKYAEPELAAYGAAKAGLMSLCRSVNREESGNGVAATAVAPGYVDTDMADYKHDPLPPDEMITVGDVVEIVDACLRLSSKAVIQEVVIERAGATDLAPNRR